MDGETTYCRKCGRMIRFIRTKRGKLMPVDSFSFNVVPREHGGLYFTEDGGTIRGATVSQPGPMTVKAWQSHFGTCPELQKEKNRQAGENWNETQERLAKEAREKRDAEAAEAAARREEKERRERAIREFEDSQYNMFDPARV